MKYPEIVAQAREAAKYTDVQYVVYECRANGHLFTKGFGYCTLSEFEHEVKQGTRPLIRLLLILPNGAIAQ